jgi:hypothetical protein
MVARLEAGDSKTSAATFAYTSTAFPMLTGTLVTVAGFLPIGFNASAAGEYTFSLFRMQNIGAWKSTHLRLPAGLFFSRQRYRNLLRLIWGWFSTPSACITYLLVHRHRHHVALEIGDDPDRAGDDEKDDQHAEREGQNVVRAVRASAQMQKEDQVNADLCEREYDQSD